VGLSAIEVVVPNPDQREKNRQVVLKLCLEEVLVHLVSSREEFAEVLGTDEEHDWEADRAPEGVATANPIPEFEHVGGVDAKGGDGGGVGREGDEVLGDVFLLQVEKRVSDGRKGKQRRKTNLDSRLEEPLPRRLSVGDRLLSSERLRSNDEERRLSVALLGDLSDVSSVNVRNEVALEALLSVRLESLSDHDGTEVGSSDTDVDDGVDGLAGVTLPLARADLVRELLHVLQHALDLVSSRLVDLELATDVAEGDVKDGTVLGGVDVLASEHVIASGLEVGLFGEVEESGEDLVVDEVLGEVDEEVDVLVGRVVGAGELVEAFGVLREEVLEDELRVLVVVELLELGPGRVVYMEMKGTSSVLSWQSFIALLTSVISSSPSTTRNNPSSPALLHSRCLHTLPELSQYPHCLLQSPAAVPIEIPARRWPKTIRGGGLPRPPLKPWEGVGEV
jgi:hypothetical protein